MPSGAKKRKAAKKKQLQKDSNNNNNNNNNNYASHSKGTENAKSHDEREGDGGQGERESFEQQEVKAEEGYDDVMINTEGDVRDFKNGEHESSSSSSSNSSSEDDEVAVEKEKSLVTEAEKLDSEASGENPVITEVVYTSLEESIPVEESVKQVVSLPQELNNGSESAAAENSVTSHVIESELKQNVDEVLPSTDENDKVSSGVTEFLQEKIETKVIQVLEEGRGYLSGSVDITAKDGDALLPQSSGVISADACCEDNHVKESETQKYVEEQPLVSSAPVAVRRTSWMNCCGLFEVFSGGASR